MLEIVNASQQSFWFFVGFALLILEALAFSFTSGVLLFAGIGALLTGALCWFGVLPASWAASIGSFAVCSALAAILLWKPLLKLQNNREPPVHDLSSDIIGYSFVLEQTISRSQFGKTHYSGIEWCVKIDESCPQDQIAAGSKVMVAVVEVGVFHVKTCS